MNSSFYKCCAVPMCKSTSISTPQKLFMNVPKIAQIRSKWLSLAGRHPASLTPTSTSHFCEDHFDLQNDMENYVEYTTMGVVSRIKLRPGCVPTRFACQPIGGSTSTSADVCRKTTAKRLRLALKKEREDEITAATLHQHENVIIEVPGLDREPLHEQQQKVRKIDKATQIHITAQNRNKTTQTKTLTCTKQTSPIRLSRKPVSTSPLKNSELKPFIKPKPFCSIVACNLSNGDKSDSALSWHTPSVALVSETSSDASSFNEPELKKVDNLKTMLDHTIDNIKKRPQFYIGVPKHCYNLINIMHEHTGIPIYQILLCLKKIRLDRNFSELSDEFEINTSYASKIFTENIPKIAEFMRPFIGNLDKSSIKTCLPIAFRKKYYDVTCLDCLEIKIQNPGKGQSLTWSEYKKANTIKYLISSTPNGLVNYISKGYGGRMSDVCLVENCDFLNCLPSGSHVMADRGFKHIEPLLLGVGCKLTRPPSTVSGIKLCKEEDKETKKIASLKIHRERVIRRIREFSSLKPHACINNYLSRNLDDIIVIACSLINLQNSLI